MQHNQKGSYEEAREADVPLLAVKMEEGNVLKMESASRRLSVQSLRQDDFHCSFHLQDSPGRSEVDMC